MEERQLQRDEVSNDKLVTDAATRVAKSLTERTGEDVLVSAVTKELGNIKYGIISDNIPFNLIVYNELQSLGISLLYKDTYVEPVSKKTWINNPSGRRTVSFKR